jgi:hypothetical protein
MSKNKKGKAKGNGNKDDDDWDAIIDAEIAANSALPQVVLLINFLYDYLKHDKY